jgi:Prenyltransferase and squalene oxidase repeat
MSTPRNLFRRLRLPLAGALFAASGLLAFVTAQPAQPGAARPPEAKADTAAPLTELKVIERVTAATDRALDYLEQKQVKTGDATGSWSTNQAFNALAMLAFMSKGHVPGRGKYGDVVEGGAVKPGVLTRAKKYMLSWAAPTGYISSSSMYEHGLATLALAEMYGMDPDPDLEAKLRKAVELIVKTQSPAGGWRYTPAPVDQDMSVTVMQVVALRAANNAEIPVPQQTFAKAIKYVRSCAGPGGGYGYAGPGSGPQTSAAGALSLQLLGRYDDPTVPRALAYLAGVPVQWGGGNPNYFYYFHYYAIQANYQAGGKQWNDWHPRVRELLLDKQNKDGSWDVPPGSAEAGLVTPDSKIYSTAMAALVLNIYMHYLPAYQR